MKTSEIKIPTGNVTLYCNLTIPEGADSIVLFSHGSGSSRFSVRNNYVASALNTEKIATLLTDLLTEEEDKVYETRFNIELLTSRLITVTNHIRHHLPETQNMAMGYFGASTGAASALKAAARLGDLINTVVSRGGRPDLAGTELTEVKASVLLIVGSLDEPVIRLNEEAFGMLRFEKKMEIIEGASHLFEEPGKLNEVAMMAADWFKHHLVVHHFEKH
jgi:putative phosphoribosyl transferase